MHSWNVTGSQESHSLTLSRVQRAFVQMETHTLQVQRAFLIIIVRTLSSGTAVQKVTFPCDGAARSSKKSSRKSADWC
eukprot:770269-Rhodomonas_salina.1